MGKRELVYGRRAVAEAKRGRRGVRRVWTATEMSASELTRLAGSPDHQGVVAEVDPYPYADPESLLDRQDALVVALDQVQDPRNLGAVCRSAEAAGAAGRGDPLAALGGGHRGGLQGIRGRRRAPAGGAGIEPCRLAHTSEGLRRLGLRGCARCPDALREADLSGKMVLVLGSEGRGLRRRVSETCDLLISIQFADASGR